ncbi:MAG TPA: GNAT family N-acetyltransferase [Ramlibacter sp.]|nr:GNAT family N-acetyltransferase [Ramlibacter sp.]
MKLLPITPQLAASEQVQRSGLLKEVCESVLAMSPGREPPWPWSGYLAQEDGDFVGTCAFKAPPQEGGVEIAYFSFPGHQGRGLATRMARALVELAQQHGAAFVRAQTLPEENASTSLLKKLGFRLEGPVEHPTDGTVWEWRLALRAA